MNDCKVHTLKSVWPPVLLLIGDIWKKYSNDMLLQLALQISLVLIREHALESPEAGYELLYGYKMI